MKFVYSYQYTQAKRDYSDTFIKWALGGCFVYVLVLVALLGGSL